MVTPLAKPGGESRFAFVDALRGLAALAVAFHHIFRYGPLPESALKIVPHFGHVLFQNGRMGVPVFFVISGFVIAYVLRRDQNRFRIFQDSRRATVFAARSALLVHYGWSSSLYGLTRAFFSSSRHCSTTIRAIRN